MHNLCRIGFETACVFLSLIMLFVPPLLPLASVATARAHFEMYCDGVGIFLAKIDGAPAPKKFVLFSPMSFPPDTFKGRSFGQGSGPPFMSFVMGASPTASARALPTAEYGSTSRTRKTRRQNFSGKYEINLNGKLLEGNFFARRHDRKHPLRLYM